MPSLFTTEDGTCYIPITSVYAIGEVKSTYYMSNAYYEKFMKNKELIDKNFGNSLIDNTCYKGVSSSTLIEHITYDSTSPWLNKIFHFMFCFSKGDVSEEHLKTVFSKDKELLPNITVMMDSYCISFYDYNYKFIKYPEHIEAEGRWIINPFNADENCSQKAKILSFFYYNLIQHINNTVLNDKNLLPFFKDLLISRKSHMVNLSE